VAGVRVSITIIRAVLGRAGRYDLDREALLCASGLSPAALEDPTGRVPFDAAARMIEFAIERVDTPSLGLQAGANLSAHAMHVVGSLLEASGTLREAHALIERFERLVYDGANHSLAVIDGGGALPLHPRNGHPRRALRGGPRAGLHAPHRAAPPPPQ
jgi:hypothetical protein